MSRQKGSRLRKKKVSSKHSISQCLNRGGGHFICITSLFITRICHQETTRDRGNRKLLLNTYSFNLDNISCRGSRYIYHPCLRGWASHSSVAMGCCLHNYLLYTIKIQLGLCVISHLGLHVCYQMAAHFWL